MKELNDARLRLAFERAKKTGRTVFLNHTPYLEAEKLFREELTDAGINIDEFRTVLYIDKSPRFFIPELKSADSSFQIELVDIDPWGNDICDCKYLINGESHSIVWDNSRFLHSYRMDSEPMAYDLEVLPLDIFGSFAQNIQLAFDRWRIVNIIFVTDCDIVSDNIIIDTPLCKAYGHMVGNDLYITTASEKFVLPEDMSYAFYGLTSLKGIWGIESLDTSQVTNMREMFNGVWVEYLDLSGFDTSNVTDMNMMFANTGCFDNDKDKYHVLDLSNFKTDKVTDMDWMFDNSEYDCVILGNRRLSKEDFT